jgi:hypothetical protein
LRTAHLAVAVFASLTLGAAPKPNAAATTDTLGGPARWLTYVSTDKPIYKTGETVYVRGVVLDAANHAPLLAGGHQPQIEIKGPKGESAAGGSTIVQDGSFGFSCTPGSVRGPLDRLVATLSAATKDRVLVVGSSHGRPPTALVLALTAWPERDAVMPFRNGRPDPLCAIYRRARVLDAAQEAIALGATALEDVLAGLDTGRVDGRDLVAIDPPREPA